MLSLRMGHSYRGDSTLCRFHVGSGCDRAFCERGIKMKTIELPIFKIVLHFDEKRPGGGSISCVNALYECCTKCSTKDCIWSCEGAHLGEVESEDEMRGRHQFNGAVDGILSTILAHACAGIDVESPAYLEGIETALQAAGENCGS